MGNSFTNPPFKMEDVVGMSTLSKNKPMNQHICWDNIKKEIELNQELKLLHN